MGFLATTVADKVDAIFDIAGKAITFMTTGEIAIFFWSGLVFTGIMLVKKLKG